MAERADAFPDMLQQRVGEMASACVACGKCFEACPSVRHAGIGDSSATAVTEGIREILRGNEGGPLAEQWAGLCTSSGRCTTVCDYGINPRFMVAMARAALRERGTTSEERRAAGRQGFSGMSRGVRTLARLQLTPAQLERVSPESFGDDVIDPDVMFYTGCNVLKTPHIVLLCLDVFDALGVRYAVAGGPQACCGVLQFRAGDMDASGRVGNATIAKLARGAGQVVSWCPSCQVQLNEVALPNRDDPAPFTLTPFIRFLEDNLEPLRKLMTHRVEKRVGLHEHPGIPGVAEGVRRILRSIEGLEFVDLPQPDLGLMCATMSKDLKHATHGDLLANAERAGVDTLAGIYHACHRDLCAHEAGWPFEVVNFMDLVGASMGIEHADVFKRLKMLADADAVMNASAGMIDAHRLDRTEVREVVVRDLLGEQSLPVRRPETP